MNLYQRSSFGMPRTPAVSVSLIACISTAFYLITTAQQELGALTAYQYLVLGGGPFALFCLLIVCGK